MRLPLLLFALLLTPAFASADDQVLLAVVLDLAALVGLDAEFLGDLAFFIGQQREAEILGFLEHGVGGCGIDRP